MAQLKSALYEGNSIKVKRPSSPRCFFRLLIVRPVILKRLFMAAFLVGSFSLLWFCGQPTRPSAEENTSLLTLERIFSSDEFAEERLGTPRWLKDGSGYTMLEPSAIVPGARDIVVYEPSGERRILVTASSLIPPGAQAPLRVDNYDLSADGGKVLILTNSRREFHKTFGDYWVISLSDPREKRQLGRSFEPSSLLNATFSPDGKKVAYAYKNNIYVEDLAKQEIVALTKDGSADIINGTFDYVYEEEFFTTHGFRWSPDSQLIAYWQLNTEKVPVFSLINNTDSLYPQIITFKFSKPGQPNATERIGVVRVTGGQTRWFDVPGDPANNYIVQLDWAANSQEIVFQHFNRRQNRNELMLGEVYSGKVSPILVETDSAWVETVTSLRWLASGNYFLWLSERDGWRHAYLVSRDGREIKLITPGDFDVESIEGVDEKTGWVYYIASPDNPTQRYLFRARLDGSGEIQRVTPADLSGTNTYNISPDARWAFHTYSNFETPPLTNLIEVEGHRVVRSLASNAKLKEKLAALKRGPVEFFRLDIGDGVLLDAWSMKPPDFNPRKRYPVIFYVYGEPWGSTVRDMWGGSRYLWHLMLTQQGYVVMSVDNRGTRVPRGRAWRKIIYGEVGILASADQAAAVRAIAKRWAWVDPERVGIWGASGGGAMTLNAMFRYPEIYRTGIALAAPADQRLYNSIYQERYMGLPEDNPDGYKNGSPVSWAHQLQGNLLIIHGTGDDNVHYQNMEVLVNELIKHNKAFTMMVYPNRRHGISEGPNTNRHKFELMTRFFKENLAPGPR